MKSTDWPVFLLAFGALLLVTTPLVVAPDASAEAIEWIYSGLTRYFGPVYLWAGVCTLVFVGYLAFGPYRSVVLGPDGEAAEFSDASWFSMLFCAGIASGLLYWGGSSGPIIISLRPGKRSSGPRRRSSGRPVTHFFTGDLRPGPSTLYRRWPSRTRVTVGVSHPID